VHLKFTIKKVIKQNTMVWLGVFGLSLGIAISLLMFAYVYFELSYDRHIENYDRIYRIISKVSNGEYRARTFNCFQEGLSMHLPQVELVTSFTRFESANIVVDNESYEIKDIILADTCFIDMFSIDVLSGNSKDLGLPNTIFITENEADKRFHGTNPIGKCIFIKSISGQANRDSLGEYTIRGIVKPAPPNTHFTFDYLISIKGNQEYFFNYTKQLKIFGWYVYIKLFKNSQQEYVEGQLNHIASAYLEHSFGPPVNAFSHKLQPLKEIYLTPGLAFEPGRTNNKLKICLF
jgi:putative ABC transport system permease protein